MEIACTNCQGRFKLPDEKLPQGQRFAVTCPKCHGKITVDTRSQTPPAEKPADAAPETPKDKTLIDEVTAGAYDAEEKPFDFIEEGGKTALLCEPDPGMRTTIKPILQSLEFNATEASTAKDALKQMRFHVFDLVVLNERFDTQDPEDNHVLKYLNHLGMSIRRNIFVALLTQRYRTSENMAAFHQSVNMVVNVKNIAEMEKCQRKKDILGLMKCLDENLQKNIGGICNPRLHNHCKVGTKVLIEKY